MAVSANRLELLQIADAVAREKAIDKEIVINAMANAIEKAAKSRYGQETNVHVNVDTKTGDINLKRLLEVVDVVEDHTTQISLELARDTEASIEIGDYVSEPLPPMDFGRIAAQSAKQVIVQQVRDAEAKQLSAVMKPFLAKTSAMATVFAHIFMTYVASNADLKFSCHARIHSSCPSSSQWKCLRVCVGHVCRRSSESFKVKKSILFHGRQSRQVLL